MKRYILALLLGAYSLSAQSALINRGGGLIYDDVQDITWLQNANLFADQYESNLSIVTDIISTVGSVDGHILTMIEIGFEPADFNSNGSMTWWGAVAWADWLVFRGYDDWRLPIVVQPDPTCSSQSYHGSNGANCTGSEMAHLVNVDGISINSPRPFENIQGNVYWAGTESICCAWYTSFQNGNQDDFPKNDLYFAWAVRDGDVTAVPVPAAIFLFSSALGLLGWIRRGRS